MWFEQPDLFHIILLLAVGLIGGVVEATAGGSGLITLPTLLMLGLQPIQALATSKFQYAFGAVAAIIRFARAGLFEWRKLAPLMLISIVAGAAGAHTITLMSSAVIALLIPAILILAAAYFAFSPGFSDLEHVPHPRLPQMMILAVPLIAFYDGFVGVGSASLYMMAFIVLRGYSVRRATATTKLVDFASGGAALIVLALKGHVLLLPGLVLALGQTIGAFIGASLVLRWGARWVRPMIVVVTILLSIQLIRQHV